MGGNIAESRIKNHNSFISSPSIKRVISSSPCSVLLPVGPTISKEEVTPPLPPLLGCDCGCLWSCNNYLIVLRLKDKEKETLHGTCLSGSASFVLLMKRGLSVWNHCNCCRSVLLCVSFICKYSYGCSELNCTLLIPAAELLELHLHFIDFKSGRKAVLSVDMSCLKWYSPLNLILVFELRSSKYVYIYSDCPIFLVMYETF